MGQSSEVGWCHVQGGKAGIVHGHAWVDWITRVLNVTGDGYWSKLPLLTSYYFCALEGMHTI